MSSDGTERDNVAFRNLVHEYLEKQDAELEAADNFSAEIERLDREDERKDHERRARLARIMARSQRPRFRPPVKRRGGGRR